MSYNFKDRLAYIGTRQDQVRGETVVYTRAGYTPISISQCPGHTDVQDLTPHTVINQAQYVDFIFFTADIVIPGLGLVSPQRGDTILWNGDLYTVTPPTDTDDVFNPTTMYKDRIRVHTLLTTVSTTTSTTTTTTTTTTSTTTTGP